jgi:exopolysaccharide biosynthesis WecB/TagA/CpsF family protein
MIDWSAALNNASDSSKTADNIQVNVESKSALLGLVAERLKNGQGFTIATLNLDHIVKLHQSDQFFQAYIRQTYVVADGNPIVWLSRLAGRKIELVPGSELVKPLITLAAKMDVPVALFGATQETLDDAANSLIATSPGLRVVARIAPPFGFNPEGDKAQECVDELAKSGARLCFLALGAPKQEIFAVNAAQSLPHCGFVSIGAGLDFIAGSQTRAPWIIRYLALEWLWRMLSSPRRLVYRYGACVAILPKLFAQAIRAR